MGPLVSGGVRAVRDRRTSVYLSRDSKRCRSHRSLWAEPGRERRTRSGPRHHLSPTQNRVTSGRCCPNVRPASVQCSACLLSCLPALVTPVQSSFPEPQTRRRDPTDPKTTAPKRTPKVPPSVFLTRAEMSEHSHRGEQRLLGNVVHTPPNLEELDT